MPFPDDLVVSRCRTSTEAKDARDRFPGEFASSLGMRPAPVGWHEWDRREKRISVLCCAVTQISRGRRLSTKFRCAACNGALRPAVSRLTVFNQVQADYIAIKLRKPFTSPMLDRSVVSDTPSKGFEYLARTFRPGPKIGIDWSKSDPAFARSVDIIAFLCPAFGLAQWNRFGCLTLTAVDRAVQLDSAENQIARRTKTLGMRMRPVLGGFIRPPIALGVIPELPTAPPPVSNELADGVPELVLWPDEAAPETFDEGTHLPICCMLLVAHRSLTSRMPIALSRTGCEVARCAFHVACGRHTLAHQGLQLSDPIPTRASARGRPLHVPVCAGPVHQASLPPEDCQA